MTVYKYFLKIAYKNKTIALIYIAVFLILAVINSNNAIEREKGFVESRLNIGIIDYCNSERSTSLGDYLKKKNNIVEVNGEEEYIKEIIFLEIADAVVIIPENFDEKVINREESINIYMDNRKIESIQIQNQINKFLSFANITYENGEFALYDVNNALDETVEVNMVKDNNFRDSKAVIRVKYIFNFIGYITLAIYIAVIGFVMNDFRKDNISQRMKTSSKKFLKFNKEMYLGHLSVAGIITSVLIIASIILIRDYIGEIYFTKYVVNLIVFSISVLCLTFLINNITKNKYIVNAISTVLSLGMSFVSGVIVPQEALSKNALVLAKFFPMYYFVRVNNMEVNSILEIGNGLLMQLLFAVVFLLIGIYFSKKVQRV